MRCFYYFFFVRDLKVMVPVSQQTLRCCILLLTARGAYEQTVCRAGREEANHTAAGREDPALTQPPLRCLLKNNIAVVCSHTMMRRHLLNSWIALHLSGPLYYNNMRADRRVALFIYLYVHISPVASFAPYI